MQLADNATPSEFPKSYQECSRILADSGATESPIAYGYGLGRMTATVELIPRGRGRPPAFAVKFHRTRIVTFEPDGSIVLDTGGWQTHTTRRAMHAAGVAIRLHEAVASVEHGGRELAYLDGMTLLPDGSATGHAGLAADVRAKRRSKAHPWTWEKPSGGKHAHGNVPEARPSRKRSA